MGRAVDELSAVTVPPTIQALLAARLDRLSLEERVVIEVAAVIGRERLPARRGSRARYPRTRASASRRT